MSDEAADGAPVRSTEAGDVVRVVAIAAAVGGAIIHFAYARSHVDEQTSHGAFFLVVAWLQLAVAVALAR
jgi:hypothetical protein